MTEPSFKICQSSNAKTMEKGATAKDESVHITRAVAKLTVFLFYFA